MVILLLPQFDQDFPPLGVEYLHRSKASSVAAEIDPAKGNPSPSWSSLFSTSAVNLKYVAPIVTEGKKSVSISLHSH